MKRPFVVKAVIALLCIAMTFHIAVAGPPDEAVILGGQKQTLFSYPHRPFLTVGSLEELRRHFSAVKGLLPEMPFKMEGKTVIASPDGTFRTTDVTGTFSPNADYVVQIEPRRDVFEYPPTSRRTRLLTWDGKLLWEKEWGPAGAIVTDEGIVIGSNMGSGTPLALIIYDRDGKEIKYWFSVFQKGYESPSGGWLRLIPEEKLILARSFNQLVAMNYSGEFLWRYSTGPGLPMIAEPKRDPLGRGIIVPTQYRDGLTNADLVDAKSGKVTSSLWEQQPYDTRIYFSPSGQFAAVRSNDQAYLMDWKTGRLLFDRVQEGELPGTASEIFKIYDWRPTALSDDPLRLAVKLRGADAIFDASGREIWRCQISSDVGYTSKKYKLSPDGQTLAVALTRQRSNSDPRELLGLLLYKVSASGDAT